MNYIVDTSIIVQALITDTHTPNVKALFRAWKPEDSLIIPEFCILECTNVLWKYVRFHGMLQSTAETLIQHLEGLPLTIHSTNGLLNRSIQVGLAHQLAIYDSIYIALAEKLSFPLITDDSKQTKAASAEGITLKAITDFT